jgi:serralysin
VGGFDSADGADFIAMLGTGNDLIFGNGGSDTVFHGVGSDTVVGGAGNDLIVSTAGSTGQTLIFGNEGNDQIVEGFVGGSARTTVIGGLGNDFIVGTGGTSGDLLFGNEDSDSISVGAGNNTVYGGNDSTAGGGLGDSADFIATGAGNDLIFGGNGNDTITGGLGPDTMSGGLGADQFLINRNLEDGVAGNSGSTVDFITDANWAEDVIHSTLASNTVNTISAATQTSINAAATLVAAAGIAAGTITGSGHIGTFTYQGDTYLFEDGATAGFQDTKDLLIRVTGATGTLSIANVVA